MAIKRYKASKDTTIVNAYQSNLRTRATGANAGMADVMEVYSIYGRQTAYQSSSNGITQASQELSRLLVEFPVTSIISDRTAGTIPASGSVSFYLRLHSAHHSKTVPRDYELMATAVSQSWQEGVGLDLETYKDLTKGNSGANWMSASDSAAWSTVGGDYLSDYTYSQSFGTGLEDLDLDITPLVESWISGTIGNYGVGVHLTPSYEAYFSSSSGANSGSVIDNTDGATKSYYTKRFFARGSQYFFKRPSLEARWNSTVKDDRGDFFYSSSLAPASDNLNTLYMYNYVRGRLTNIPGIGTGEIFVNLYSGSSAPTGSALEQSVATPATGGWVSTGIYSCSVCLTAAASPLTTLFDVWYSGSTEYFTGSITPVVATAAQTVAKPVYYLNITNLKNKYRGDEVARFNLYVRNKFWSPTIYTVANSVVETTTIPSASYRVFRTLDAFEAVPYNTGSDLATGLSYDVSGNYFDFNMNLLEPGFSYAFKFAFYDPALDSWTEQPEVFKFRVESYEY